MRIEIYRTLNLYGKTLPQAIDAIAAYANDLAKTVNNLNNELYELKARLAELEQKSANASMDQLPPQSS